MPIRISSRPAGDAPDWVRDAWIGLTLPTRQTSPRVWRAMKLANWRGNVFLRLWDMLRGKSYRCSGYAVNGKAAVAVLEKSRPDAADWWKTHAGPMVTGRSGLIFDAACCEQVDGPTSLADALWGTGGRSTGGLRNTYPASPGRIALLWVLTTLAHIAAFLLPAGDAFGGISSLLYLGATPVLSAFLAAWLLRLRASTLHLVTMLLTFDLLSTCLGIAMALVIDREGLVWFATGLYALLLAGTMRGAMALFRSRARWVATFLMVIALHAMAGSPRAIDRTYWQASSALHAMFQGPSSDDRDPPPEIEADRLWGAQPALVEKSIAAWRPPIAGVGNVYAMAVAGSGEQALFSREAHEALRVAAQHFGDSSRGSALLSNGEDDLLQAPLATRDNIGAIAGAMGHRMDPRQDVLFAYLVSHGSRSAELASALPDYQYVQPISAATTAEALRRAGISRRIIVVSACFAGAWIPALASDDTIVIAAAAKDRTSFGCDDSRKFTVFGEAFLGSLAIRGISLHGAFEDAKRKIAIEEARDHVTPSLPQAFVGRNMMAFWDGTWPQRR